MAKNTTIRVAVPIALFLFLGVQSASADILGDRQAFFIDSTYDYQSRSGLDATLRHLSGRAYFYVDNQYWNSLNPYYREQLERLMNDMGAEFDSRIYPTEVAFFGSEPTPGIDNDARVTMLLVPLKQNVGGYFDSANGYSKQRVPYSNERDMLYLNTSQFSNTRRMYPFVAHEFQHLISFNQKELLRGVTDDVWLNELRSEYATTLLGYNQPYYESNFERRVNSFLQSPSDSLTEWPNTYLDYGQAAMLGEYIAEHWSSQVIAKTLFSGRVGIDSLNDSLSRNGFAVNFDDIFSNWMIANLINNTSINPLYGYTKSELQSVRVPPTERILDMEDASVMVVSMNMKNFEQRWYDLQNLESGEKNTLSVKFNTSIPFSEIRIPYVAFGKDGRVQYKHAVLAPGVQEILIPEIGTNIARVVIMPYRRSQSSGFGSHDAPAQVAMTIQRVTDQPVNEDRVTPEQFGLHEGDFIRAENDKDVFIINQFGYKRIVLSPQICLQYGHLGARGCFGAVKTVTSAVRDAFITSPYYTNGETLDGKIYKLIETGEDSAYLEIAISPSDINSVFYVNTREQNSYL